MRGGASLPGMVMFTDGKRVSVAYRDGEGIGVATFAATPVPPLPPLLRGVGALFAMVRDAWRASAHLPDLKGFTPLEALLSGVLSLLTGGLLLFLVLVLPVRLVDGVVERSQNPFLWYGLFEFLSLLVLLAFFRLMALLPWSGRVLQLHGAEHQVAHAFARNLPLEEEAVREMPVLHPRCGTNFLGLSALVAALFYALVLPLPGGHPLFWPLKLLLLPVAVGLGYEAFLLAQRFPLLLTLGYLFQRITVGKPSPEDRKVAIAAAWALRETP